MIKNIKQTEAYYKFIGELKKVQITNKTENSRLLKQVINLLELHRHEFYKNCLSYESIDLYQKTPKYISDNEENIHRHLHQNLINYITEFIEPVLTSHLKYILGNIKITSVFSPDTENLSFISSCVEKLLSHLVFDIYSPHYFRTGLEPEDLVELYLKKLLGHIRNDIGSIETIEIETLTNRLVVIKSKHECFKYLTPFIAELNEISDYSSKFQTTYKQDDEPPELDNNIGDLSNRKIEKLIAILSKFIYRPTEANLESLLKSKIDNIQNPITVKVYNHFAFALIVLAQDKVIDRATIDIFIKNKFLLSKKGQTTDVKDFQTAESNFKKWNKKDKYKNIKNSIISILKE